MVSSEFGRTPKINGDGRPRPLAEGVQRGARRRRHQEGLRLRHVRRDGERAGGRPADGRGPGARRSTTASASTREKKLMSPGNRPIDIVRRGQAAQGTAGLMPQPRRSGRVTEPHETLTKIADTPRDACLHATADIDGLHDSHCARCRSLCLCRLHRGRRSPRRRRWAASSRAARSAGPRPSFTFSGGAPGRRARSPLLLARLHGHEARSGQRRPGQGDGQDRRRLPARRARRPRPHRHRHHRAADVLGRRPAGRRREGAEQRVRRRRRRSRSTSPSTASSTTRTSTTSPSRPRRASGCRVEVEGHAARRPRFFDPYVAILDSKRFELATSDDSPLFKQDGVPVDRRPGRRHVHRAWSARAPTSGNGACQYRLHVGTFPRPTGRRPRRRQAGRGGRGHVPRRPGRRRSSRRSSCRRRCRRTANFEVFCQDAGGISPSGLPFRLSATRPTSSKSSRTTPRPRRPPATLPCAFNGVIEKPADIDHFKFTAKKGQMLRRPLLRPPARLAARPGHVHRPDRPGGAWPATTTPSARTATSA